MQVCPNTIWDILNTLRYWKQCAYIVEYLCLKDRNNLDGYLSWLCDKINNAEKEGEILGFSPGLTTMRLRSNLAAIG